MKRSMSSIPMTPEVRRQMSAASFSRQRNSFRLSSISSGRPSLGLLSSFSGRPSYQDSRCGNESKQQTDRSSLSKNVKHVIEFLQENKYPYQLSKLQSSPSAKDVMSIFEFLLSMIMPEYRVGSKFENSFPAVMKMLRYLYTLTKRQLQPVGSMHNWPIIVAGFAWLTNIVKLNKEIDGNYGLLGSDLELPSNLDIVMQFHLNAFKKLLAGNDDHDALDKEFEDSLPSMLCLESFEHVERMSAELKERQAELEKLTARNMEYSEKLSDVEADIEKTDVYLGELESYLAHMNESKTKLEVEFSKRKEEHEMLVEEIGRKQSIVDSQKFSAGEVKQLQSTIAELDHELVRLAAIIVTTNENVLAEEEETCKLRTEAVTLIERYNELAVNCQIIPATADNAQGFNYELQPSMVDSESCPHADEVEARLDIILKQFKAQARELRSREMEFLNTLDTFDEAITSLKGDITDAEANVRRKEEALDLSKQEKAQELQLLQMEIDSGEKETDELKQMLTMSLDLNKAQAEAQELKKCTADLERNLAAKRADFEVFLQSKNEMVKEHVKQLQEMLDKFTSFSIQMKAKFFSLTVKPLMNHVIRVKEDLDSLDKLSESVSVLKM